MRERTFKQAGGRSGASSADRGRKAARRNTIPNMKELVEGGASIRAYIRERLLASPLFPEMFANVVLHAGGEAGEFKTLIPNYKTITERTSKTMPARSCRHIKVTGVRCGSPAMHGEEFCYFHLRMLRTIPGPASRVHHAALLEDHESIQASLVETVNAILRGSIDLKRAELVLRALNIAVRNMRNVHFGLHPERMVKDIPDYETPPPEQVDEDYAAELRRRRAREQFEREYARLRAAAEASRTTSTSQASTTQTSASQAPATAVPKVSAPPDSRGDGSCGDGSCGDGSLTRPGGPEVSGRSAVPKPEQAQSAPTRKPPVSVKEAPASGGTRAQERQMVAHRARGG